MNCEALASLFTILRSDTKCEFAWPHKHGLFLDKDREKGSVVEKQNVRLGWMEKDNSLGFS